MPALDESQHKLTNIQLTSMPENERVLRINSRDIMRQMREIEIDHEGRIYRLRVTQLNKLILTA
jgi:hemin uptake protein HemP